MGNYKSRKEYQNRECNKRRMREHKKYKHANVVEITDSGTGVAWKYDEVEYNNRMDKFKKD